jgi:hypothetical protein
MLNKKNTALQLGRFLALVASLLIAGQIAFTLYYGTPLCLNSGCKVVENLTKVSPLVLNLVGLCFFQFVYWGLRSARGELRRLPQFIRTLLLAALGAEAVLIGFQYFSAQAFCVYCLGICAFVVLLNLLLGFRQIGAGILIFSATLLAFASLNFSQPPTTTNTATPSPTTTKQAFADGVFSSRPGLLKSPEHYLFYASTCPHCEKVIASLKNNARSTLFFNPIDKVSTLDLPNVSRNTDYSPAANKALLTALGIDEIPVLMTKTAEGWTIRRGDAAIIAYLSSTSINSPKSGESTSGQSGQSSVPGVQAIPGLDTSACRVGSDCASSSAEQTR